MRLSILYSAITLATLSLTGCGGLDKPPQPTTVQKTRAGSTENTNNNHSSNFKVDEGISMNISGAGASFPALIYGKWLQEYNNTFGGNVSYNSIGSSNGIEQISSGSVDFGASDIPLKASELEAKGLIQFPTVIGGVTPIINIEGVQAGQMILDGPTLAKIYQGKITTWNDQSITKLNPTLSLPNTKIITVHRSGRSGTTYNFSHYLSKSYSSWGTASKKLQKTNNSINAEKSQGMADVVKNTANSIGYIDFSYAKEYNLVYTSMMNSTGNIIQPSHKTFSAAGDVNWEDVPGFYKLIGNSKNPNAWPIATTTFILVSKKPKNPKQVAGVLSFFNWAYMEGYQSALDLDFVPFSDKPVATFFNEWNKVVDEKGNPIYTVNSII